MNVNVYWEIKKKENRRCMFPECKTILSKHNETSICCIHHRIMKQNEIVYSENKKRFMRQVEINSTTGLERISIEELLTLKEIEPEEILLYI